MAAHLDEEVESGGSWVAVGNAPEGDVVPFQQDPLGEHLEADVLGGV